MELSLAISGLALVVSVLSFVVSKRSYDRAGRIHEQSQLDAGAQRKRELLVLMSDCRATLNSTRVDIGALKAVFDAEPQPVRALLKNFVGLFNDYLPNIERALASLDADRQAVANWAGNFPVVDLERQHARIYDDLKTFQFVGSNATSLIATFKEKLGLAREATYAGRR
jgi:hypothetical protein